MTFLVFEANTLPSGHKDYRRREEVKLAGNGLIYRSCRGLLKSENSPWHITSNDLLKVGGYDPDAHSLVIDIAPGRKSVNFCEIKSIAGYSYAEWTPLMLRLEVLFAEEYDGDEAEIVKKRFVDDACTRDRVREFLYLTGGYKGGKWNWGGNHRTTAALIWDDAWNHFQTIG